MRLVFNAVGLHLYAQHDLERREYLWVRGRVHEGVEGRVHVTQKDPHDDCGEIRETVEKGDAVHSVDWEPTCRE